MFIRKKNNTDGIGVILDNDSNFTKYNVFTMKLVNNQAEINLIQICT